MNPYFNEQSVLEYIKQHFGVPFNILEFDDDYIINNVILNHNYLKEFSAYFPKEERVPLTQENNYAVIMNKLKDKEPDKRKLQTYQYENSSNKWVVEPEDGSEVLGVKRLISNNLIDMLPFYDITTGYSNPIDVGTYNLNHAMMNNNLSYKFTYPNLIEVFGLGYNLRLNYALIAICETVHKNIDTIPASLHTAFNKFCLYTLANLVLHIRNKYENMSTPFGELNLNTSWIQQIADKKQELLEEFRKPANYNQRAVGIFVY